MMHGAQWGNPSGILQGGRFQQVRTAGAHISHVEQPALPKIALDIKVPLLVLGRAETPNGEE